MKRFTAVLVVAYAVLGVAALAQANVFTYAPEDYAPGWVSDYPYQRNILWDFESGLDAEYTGYDDALLSSEDVVTVTGAVQWLSAFGAIGIDNSNGGSEVTGTISLYLNNHDRTSPFKHVWVETPQLAGMDVTGASLSLSPPQICFSSPVAGADLFFWARADDPSYNWYVTTPENPPYEEITFTLAAGAGQLVYLDSIHIATECAVVPVPGAALLAAMGLGLAGGIQRRRRK